MAKRWTKEEDELLKEIHTGKTYDEITDYFPNRTRMAIETRCQLLGFNKSITKESASWTNEENDLLITYYSTSTIDELLKIIPNKTKGAIQTQSVRLNLYKTKNTFNKIRAINSSKSPNYWTNERNEKLILDFNNGIDVYQSFAEFTPNFIKKKLIENGLIDKTDFQKVQDIVDYKDINELNLNDVFKLYKLILSQEIDGFSFYSISKEQLIFCFKYFLRVNNIETSRREIKNFIIGDLLNDAKIKHHIKKKFNGYYDFISSCFPRYKLHEWEFKWLDVSEGFWEDKYNCFHVLDVEINKLIKNSVISNKAEILSIPLHILRGLIHNTLITYHSYQIILEYLDFNKIDYSYYSNKICDGILFDSKEELIVYKIIKQHFPNIIKGKKKNRVINNKENEGYIPDFIIDDYTFIEYYGMFKENNKNNIFKEYVLKTHRKNEFYKSYCNNFLAIYPNELLDINKLNTKIELFKNSLRGGEIIEKHAIRC